MEIIKRHKGKIIIVVILIGLMIFGNSDMVQNDIAEKEGYLNLIGDHAGGILEGEILGCWHQGDASFVVKKRGEATLKVNAKCVGSNARAGEVFNSTQKGEIKGGYFVTDKTKWSITDRKTWFKLSQVADHVNVDINFKK
tara:strand:- start:36 stop:455 length:420 start_codon:yes stop_codon:yes gene_type:complete